MKKIIFILFILFLLSKAQAQQTIQFIIPTNAASSQAILSAPARQLFPIFLPAESYPITLAPGTNSVLLNPGFWTVAWVSGGSYSFNVSTNTLATNNWLALITNGGPPGVGDQNPAVNSLTITNASQADLNLLCSSTGGDYITFTGNNIEKWQIGMDEYFSDFFIQNQITGAADMIFGINDDVLATNFTAAGNMTNSGSFYGAGNFTAAGNMTNSGSFYGAGNINAAGGFASGATNQYSFSPTGYTNSGSTTIRVFGFTGTNFIFSNSVSKVYFTIGTVTNQYFTLNPNESLQGTNCTVAGAVDF